MEVLDYLRFFFWGGRRSTHVFYVEVVRHPRGGRRFIPIQVISDSQLPLEGGVG